MCPVKSAVEFFVGRLDIELVASGSGPLPRNIATPYGQRSQIMVPAPTGNVCQHGLPQYGRDGPSIPKQKQRQGAQYGPSARSLAAETENAGSSTGARSVHRDYGQRPVSSHRTTHPDAARFSTQDTRPWRVGGRPEPGDTARPRRSASPPSPPRPLFSFPLPRMWERPHSPPLPPYSFSRTGEPSQPSPWGTEGAHHDFSWEEAELIEAEAGLGEAEARIRETEAALREAEAALEHLDDEDAMDTD